MMFEGNETAEEKKLILHIKNTHTSVVFTLTYSSYIRM